MKILTPLFAMLLALVEDLKEDSRAAVDLGVVLMIGIAFAGLMVIAYIIWTISDMLTTTASSTAQNNSLHNITGGFDNSVNMLIVAITIFILAIAIAALMMLRGRQ